MCSNDLIPKLHQQFSDIITNLSATQTLRESYSHTSWSAETMLSFNDALLSLDSFLVLYWV